MRLLKRNGLLLTACTLCVALVSCATQSSSVRRVRSEQETSIVSVESEVSSDRVVVSADSDVYFNTTSAITSSQSTLSDTVSQSSQQTNTQIQSSKSNTTYSSYESSHGVSSQPTSVSTFSYTSSITTVSSSLTDDKNYTPDYLVGYEVCSGTRDPYLWPFSKDSIWNMPIGSDAVYEKAGFKQEYHLGYDTEYFVQTTESDPIVNVYSPSSFKVRMPGNKLLGTLRVPDWFMLADCSGNSTPNNCATFIMPNGITYYQLEPTCRTPEYMDRIIGWIYGKEMSLYSQGIGGTHYGSGLSAIGGSIRKGELTSSDPIRHAIKINVFANNYCYYGSQALGFVWPADRSDSYASQRYGGTNPKLAMGSLLALPRDLTVEDLGLETEVGKKIFYALQNYGAYISDDSAWSAYDICVESGVNEEVQSTYGFSLSANNGPYYRDMIKMIEKLCIITNNSPTSIGGGGTPCQPLAPDFE